MGDICYRVELADPGAHTFRVRLTVNSPAPSGQNLNLPAWIPGSYMIRDFAKNIVSIEAFSGSESVALKKLDKQTWRAGIIEGPLTVIYRVYAWDLSVRSAHFDTTHAYFNGTSLFLQVAGQEHACCKVELLEPNEAWSKGWKVATSFEYKGRRIDGFGEYLAKNYADLIDHPVEIGNWESVKFSVNEIPHKMVIYGRHKADYARLGSDLEKICSTHAELFGELPLQRYLFLVMAVGDGYGGLEHCSSTSLLCNRDDLPRIGEGSPSDGYTRFLGLCSHEYFHLWNVKRIRPEYFKERGLEAEVNTELLWVFEGFTSYYDDLTLVRSGCIGPESYLELLAQVITRVQRGAGRQKQSVAESSFDTWTKFYKQDENASNAIVSYYTKGALVALALDLLLRERTSDRCSLDQIMRALWTGFGKTEMGVPERSVEVLVQEISGLELHDFFRNAVYGTDELPIKETLQLVGVDMQWRVAKNAKDLGGHAKDWSEVKSRKDLGLRLINQGEAKVSHVFDGGAAQKAGIAAGDILLALDGLRVTPDNLDALLNRVPGDLDMELVLFRRDELMRFVVHPQSAPKDTCELRFSDTADNQQLARRGSWLRL